MAVTSIKTTYSLDVETVEALEQMARRWRVSKSEALRRAIRLAAGQTAGGAAEALTALDSLQASLGLDTEGADDWEKARQNERSASSRRSER